MNFNDPLLKPVRILLFPFSLLYALAVWTRNTLYNAGVLRSQTFELPLICVGNLSAGGTGKSPMVEYLVRLLSPKFNSAVLSRGYKRKTEGYLLADANASAATIGDEPMQIFRKFPAITVAVGEKRAAAIPEILRERPSTDFILLDDAFQHRQVKAGINILLTDFNELYADDWFLPTGNLRDEKRSADRAEIIVVTKCPNGLNTEQKDKIRNKLNPKIHQNLFFTTIAYGAPYHIFSNHALNPEDAKEVLLITGIANPVPLREELSSKAWMADEMIFADHHEYSEKDIAGIKEKFQAMNISQKIIITTEK
ncbi:MAG: tetraacyldisaccharide 4'-kinase, partial [Flavitalea sp.]